MEPISLNPTAAGPDALRPSHSPEDRALVHAVSEAARRLNEAGYAGEGRAITFSLDPATRLPLIKVVDEQTRETLSQWPSAYLLELAAEQLHAQG